MKKTIIFFSLFFFSFNVWSQKIGKDTIPVIISVNSAASGETSASMMVKIDLSYHDIDRIFFEDESGDIPYAREIEEIFGEQSYLCQVVPLKCNTKFNWTVVVHSKKYGVIKKLPFSFSTSECINKKKK